MDSFAPRKVFDANATSLKGRLAPYDIRSLSRKHAESVVKIAGQSFSKVWTVSEFIYFLNHQCGFNWGCFEKENLVGYLIGLNVRGDLDIVSVATLPECRRRGLARELLRGAQRDSQIESIHLEVGTENLVAIELYRSLGFRDGRIRYNYYDGSRDALDMNWVR